MDLVLHSVTRCPLGLHALDDLAAHSLATQANGIADISGIYFAQLYHSLPSNTGDQTHGLNGPIPHDKRLARPSIRKTQLLQPSAFFPRPRRRAGPNNVP